MTKNIDLLALGKDVVRQVYRAVSRMPIEDRAVIISEREGDETRKIDKVADDVVYKHLERAARTHGLTFHLLSEERGKEPAVIGRGTLIVYGILDPVDGSWNAITNIPFYSCNLAFTRPMEQDEVALGDFDLGVIGDLASGRLYFAQRKGRAYQQDRDKIREVFTSKETDPRKSRIIMDSYLANDRVLCENKFMPLRLGFKDHGRYYGAGRELVTLLAPEGTVPGYVGHVSMDQKPDNIIAGNIIVEAGGGIASDWDNKPLDDYPLHSRPNVVFSANKAMHEQIIDFLNLSYG